MFCNTINDMIHSLTFALNFWYLDDGNLADKFRVVFEDLKLVIERARMLGLKVKPSKCELTFLGSPSEELKLEILQLFNTICPAIQETPLDDLCILGAGMGADFVLDKLTKRSKDFELLSERLVEIEAHSALFILKNSFSIPKLTFLLRTSPCFMHPDILSNCDSILTSTLEKITNVQLTDSSRIQACLPVKMVGLGLPSASLLATSCFLSSASSCAALSDQIATCTGPTGDKETALEFWGDTAQALPPTNRSTQKIVLGQYSRT